MIMDHISFDHPDKVMTDKIKDNEEDPSKSNDNKQGYVISFNTGSNLKGSKRLSDSSQKLSSFKKRKSSAGGENQFDGIEDDEHDDDDEEDDEDEDDEAEEGKEHRHADKKDQESDKLNSKDHDQKTDISLLHPLDPIRLEQNKLAARRSRLRKKMEVQELKDLIYTKNSQLQRLQDENSILKERVNELLEDMQSLLAALRERVESEEEDQSKLKFQNQQRKDSESQLNDLNSNNGIGNNHRRNSSQSENEKSKFQATLDDAEKETKNNFDFNKNFNFAPNNNNNNLNSDNNQNNNTKFKNLVGNQANRASNPLSNSQLDSPNSSNLNLPSSSSSSASFNGSSKLGPNFNCTFTNPASASTVAFNFNNVNAQQFYSAGRFPKQQGWQTSPSLLVPPVSSILNFSNHPANQQQSNYNFPAANFLVPANANNAALVASASSFYQNGMNQMPITMNNYGSSTEMKGDNQFDSNMTHRSTTLPPPKLIWTGPNNNTVNGIPISTSNASPSISVGYIPSPGAIPNLNSGINSNNKVGGSTGSGQSALVQAYSNNPIFTNQYNYNKGNQISSSSSAFTSCSSDPVPNFKEIMLSNSNNNNGSNNSINSSNTGSTASHGQIQFNHQMQMRGNSAQFNGSNSNININDEKVAIASLYYQNQQNQQNQLQ